jgi:hypothetical protein
MIDIEHLQKNVVQELVVGMPTVLVGGRLS